METTMVCKKIASQHNYYAPGVSMQLKKLQNFIDHEKDSA